VRTVRFVKRAQTLGFSLDEIDSLLDLAGGGPESCEAARELATEKISGLEARIAQLQAMADSLRQLVDSCWETRDRRLCPLLEAIEVVDEQTDKRGARHG
ncbi:MAG: MerR family DNA-binding protein, partial [Acidimicrobiales bacterium]